MRLCAAIDDVSVQRMMTTTWSLVHRRSSDVTATERTCWGTTHGAAAYTPNNIISTRYEQFLRLSLWMQQNVQLSCE